MRCMAGAHLRILQADQTVYLRPRAERMECLDEEDLLRLVADRR